VYVVASDADEIRLQHYFLVQALLHDSFVHVFIVHYWGIVISHETRVHTHLLKTPALIVSMNQDLTEYLSTGSKMSVNGF